MKYIKLFEDFVPTTDIYTKIFNGIKGEGGFTPETEQEKNIVRNMLKGSLLDYDTEVEHDENSGAANGSCDYYWLTDEGEEEIKSSQDIEGYDYNMNSLDKETEVERAYFRGSEGGGGHD